MAEMTFLTNFSRAAGSYDANARVQALAARELLSRSRGDASDRILELGCGTGLYTRMLLESFPNAAIRAIDASEKMVAVAREQITSPRVSFSCADAETFTTGSYHLMTSNASLHWFRDLAGTLVNLQAMLDDGGVLTFSYFGPNTYRELQESLRQVVGPSVALTCSSFLSVAEITGLLDGVFRTCRVEKLECQEHFDSLRDLLSNIKLTGTRGAGLIPKITWTPGLLRILESTYIERFGEIRVTYQFYICRAEK